MKTLLPNRAVISLSGADADSLLQGIITNDIGLLEKQPMLYSAMLTAQGKFAHDFFIHSQSDSDERLIDIDASQAADFMQKLKRYKLRADVSISDVSATHKVFAAWGEQPDGCAWKADPRLEALGWRAILTREPAAEEQGGEGAYSAHRLALAVPECAEDATERHFALELGLDQLHGVSFTKGCFVGQEPTARMHYRKVLRKGLFAASAQTPLAPAGTPIMAGDAVLGEMRSSEGSVGLAFCRMEPVQKAQAAGAEITANGTPLTLQTPRYMQAKWDEILSADSA